MYDEFDGLGVTENTPDNLLLGAGTIHKNLLYGYYIKDVSGTLTVVADDTEEITELEIKLSEAQKKCDETLSINDKVKFIEKWNARTSLLGATSGGNKFSVKPTLKDIELDGANVKVKGLTKKFGEIAKLEINFAEITQDIISKSTFGTVTTSGDELPDGYDLIESRSDIVAGDYFDNIAFVGSKGDGKPVIVILDNAICTSGFEADNKKGDKSVTKLTFECTQTTTGNLNKLPWHIYYPKEATIKG